MAALVGVGLIAAGCSSGGGSTDASDTAPKGTINVDLTKKSDAPAKDGGKLVYGLNAESDGFAPAVGRWSASTYIIGFSIMDPLTAYDADLNPQPYLAKSLDSNADFTEWTMKLRGGITFHNGDPVDAAIVKKNLDAQKASSLTGETMAFVKDGPDGITTPDSLTVVVHMKKPWSTFPHILTAQVGAIASQSTIDPTGTGNRNPVGSGPFVFDQWTPEKNLTVHKNTSYWRKGYPHLDNIEFRPMADIQSRSKALDAGDVNMFETNDPQQITTMTDRAQNGGDVQIFTDQKGNPAKIFVGLNMTVEPFNDPIARQAVAYAGNVDDLSETAYQGIFPPAYGPFSKNSPFFSDVPDYPKHDLAKAKELNAEYEAKHGKPIEFSANITTAPEVAQVGQVLQQQQKEAGIIVHLEPMEQITLILKALTGDYQATGFILFGSPHLDREYVFIAAPAKPKPQVSLNFTRIGLDANGQPNDDNKAIVDAMDKARTTQDPVEQKKQYAIVQAEMAKNLNFLFLVGETNAIVSDKSVRGALEYHLPDPSGGDGVIGMPTVQTFTFNLWLDQ